MLKLSKQLKNLFSMQTEIYLARHGESKANIENIMDGHFNTPLTEKGLEQAVSLAKALHGIKFDALYCSDLIRTRQTAETLNQQFNLPIISLPLLRERFGGSVEGKPFKEFLDSYKENVELWQSLQTEQRWDIQLAPGMETDREILGRMLRALKQIAVEQPGKIVLTVSHGGIMRALLIYAKWLPITELTTQHLDNCGYIRLLTDGENIKIEQVVGLTKNQ
jgi:broad specificity phosphatase PhoE